MVSLRNIRGTPAYRTAAKGQVATITRYIVDTANLTDGQLVFDRAIALGNSQENPLEIARRALVGSTDPLAHAIGPGRHSAAPVQIIPGKVTGTIWHHGTGYTSAWVGKPSSIAHHAKLSDNEREALLLQARKLAAHGSIVYAVAISAHTDLPASYRDQLSNVAGLLVLHPVLYPGTEEVVGRIHASGADIIYISKDTEHTVQTFAAASLIADQTSIPFVYRPGRPLPESAQLYASLDDTTYAKVLASLKNDRAVVVDGPLPVFWAALSR